MIGKRFRSLPFIFANDNYTLRRYSDIFLNFIEPLSQMCYSNHRKGKPEKRLTLEK